MSTTNTAIYELFRTHHALLHDIVNTYKTQHLNGGETINLARAMVDKPELRTMLQLDQEANIKALRNYIRYYVQGNKRKSYYVSAAKRRAILTRQQAKAEPATQDNGTQTKPASRRVTAGPSFCPQCGCDMRAIAMALQVTQEG